MIRVAIIEDTSVIREGLCQLISSYVGYQVTGGYPSMEEALSRIGGQLPDVVLVDIGLPGMSGIEGIREIKRLYPGVQLLVLSVYGDDARIFEAICAGACGYLLKKTPPARLLESIAEVAGGGAPMSPEVARRVVDLFRTIRPPERAQHDLTPHELKLLQLMVDGRSRKAVSKELGVSVHTVAFHLRRVYEKLEVHSRSEAVAKALRDRLIK